MHTDLKPCQRKSAVGETIQLGTEQAAKAELYTACSSNQVSR